MKRSLYSRLFVFPVCAALLFLAIFSLNIPATHAQDAAILLTGRVTADDGGAPIPNVDIYIIDNSFPQNPTFLDAAVSDSMGYYTVTEVITSHFTLPGNYILLFDADAPYADEYYNDTNDRVEAELLTFSADAPLTNINAALALGGSISGRVLTGDDNQALDKAVITLFDLDGDPIRDVGAYVTADSNGNYTVPLVPPGIYRISAEPINLDIPYVRHFYPDAWRFADGEIIDVSPGEVIANINFTLPVGGLIKGTIYSREGMTSTPIAFVSPKIEVFDQNGEQVPALFPPGAGDTGEYIISNLLPGSYRLYLQDATGWNRPEYYNNVQSLEAATPITISAGQIISDVDAELAFIPRVYSLATSSALSDTILLTLHRNRTPIFTSNGGDTWWKAGTTPWLRENFATTPFVGLAPRTEAGSRKRLIVTDQAFTTLYRSGDSGQIWAEQSFHQENCSENEISAPVASPLAPTRLFIWHRCVVHFNASTLTLRTFRSTDAGVTWQQLPGLEAMRLVLSPSVANRAYAFGWYKTEKDRPAQWFKSDNGGDSWAAVDFSVERLILDAENPDNLYGLGDAGKRSTDGGEQWVDWAQQPCRFELFREESELVQLMAHPTKTNMLFLICPDGLYRSVHGGDAWTRIATTPGHIGHLLAPDYGHPGRILWAKDDGLWASADDGDTWQPIMPNYALTDPSELKQIVLPNILAPE